jgi:hypothetical protein
MFRKSTSIVALGIMTAVIATATSLAGGKMVSLLKPVAPETATEAVATASDVATSPAQKAAIDYEALNAEALQTVIGRDARPEPQELGDLVDADFSPLGEPSEALKFADANILASLPKKAPKKVAKADAEVSVKTGSVVEIEHLTSGTNYGFRSSIALVDSTDASKGYQLNDFYSIADTVALKFTVDAEAGTVSVPKQELYNYGSYGPVSFVGLVTVNGTRYLTNDPVTGTIDEDGNVSLGSWGLILTDPDSKYYGYSLALVSSSEWKLPNATAAGVNMTTEESEEYGIYVSQGSESSVSFFGLTAYPAELTARVTSSKTVVMPYQFVYTNSYLGAFNIYGATWTETSGTWKASVNTKTAMVFSTTADNTLTMSGWVVSSASYPSQYVAQKYRDFSITTTAISWPAVATNTFEGAGTAASPYLIKTAADFTQLSQLVSEGNTFQGSYFELANDVDMTSISAKSYVPIGDDTNKFAGIFDGKEHAITNMSIDGGAFTYTGIFGVTDSASVIKNLNVKAFKAVSDGSYLGTICGYNYGPIDNCNISSAVLDNDGSCVGGFSGLSSGNITNCSFIGQVTGTGSAGGIVGQAACSIENCYVKGYVITDGYVSLCFDNGGIAGVLQNGTMKNCWMTGLINETYGRSSAGGLIGRCVSSTVENCFSTALIYAKRTYTDTNGGGDNYTGGLLGYTYNSTMNNCFSSSTIVKSGTSEFCGGIVGYIAVGYQTSTSYSGMRMTNNSKISNCYYSGYINSTSTTSTKPMFGSTFYYSSWTGEDPDKLCFTNCYYDKQVNFMNEDYYGRSTSFFTNGLPEGFSSDVWEAKAGYYPTLKNVGAGTQAQALASAPIYLNNNQTAKKVKGSFTVATADNVTWALYGATDNETSALKMEGNTVTVKDVYASSQVNATTADGYGAKMYLLAVVPKLFDGEGSAESPYLIKSVADLKILNSAVGTYAQDHSGDYFAMTNDIDCTTAEGETAFQGVGSGTGYTFGGNFDGRGYSIKNLTINALDADSATTNSTLYAGLIANLNEDGTVKNVVIDKSCKFDLYRYSAPVVGVNYGVVDNCRNYADVKSVSTSNGGVVGFNYSGTISNCYNSGRISVGTTYGGGITGYNAGTITMCQNDADVIGEKNNASNANVTQSYVGGIAGYNAGTIEMSVNDGQVNANNTVGGITGRNAAGNITGCLNNGLVTSTVTTAYRGAIIGYQQSLGTIANNYYDSSININGASHGASIDGVTGCSTAELTAGVCPAELKQLGADEVFDFTANNYPVLKQFANEEAAKALRKVYVAFVSGQVRNNVVTDVALSPADDVEWSIDENAYFKVDGKKLVVTVPSDTVPTLTLNAKVGDYAKSYELTSVPVIFSGSGTADSPYLIETPADWNKLADFVDESKWEYNGQYFKITNDLDFNGDSIRVIAVNGAAFQGVMDGAGHTIKNYVYSNTNSVSTASKLVGPNLYLGRYIGLFGTLGSNSEVKNLILDGKYEGYSNLGGLVGYAYGKISNVTHKGTISNTSGTSVAGIAFRLYSGGSITDCVNEGSVTAKTQQAAGICVETQAGTVLERCYNRGTVKATTIGACGIAYKVSGGLIDCGNEKSVLSGSTGTVIGIANTVDSTAYAVRCYNIADLGTAAQSTICGVFGTFTARKTNDPTYGYVQDCYNTGNITAKDSGYGFANKINAGWTVTNCHNTGNVTSLGLACGFCTSIAGSSVDLLAVLDHCYNTGNVTGKKACVSGLMSEAGSYSKMTYCYNTGKVVNTLTTGLTSGGLVGKFNGNMDHCFNAGDVVSACNATGGLVGYISYGKEDYPGRILNSFNIGNVTCEGFTGTSTNGNAGGLSGYLATSNATYWVEIENCFNSGIVKSNTRVGGITGGAFSGYPVVKNCYNSGKVIATAANGVKSATVYANTASNAASVVNNCYFDKSAYTDADTIGVGLTTSQFKELTISDGFEASADGGYPVIKGFESEAVASAALKAGAVMILVADEATQNQDKVAGEIDLVAPTGTTWAVYESNASGALVESSKMTIDGNTAKPVADGDVVLVATTPDNFCRTFNLTLNTATSGIDGVNAGKTVESVIYVDIQGRVVAQPTPGNVYIVRTNYTDGTSSIAKKLAR